MKIKWVGFLVAAMLLMSSSLGAAAPGDEILVGGNFEITGGLGSFGKAAVNGIRLAFKEVNTDGGVLGRQIKFIIGDNRSQVQDSITVMEVLADRKVVAVLGPVASSNALAAQHISHTYGIPVISPTATNSRVVVENGRVKPYAFRVCFEDPYQGKIMAHFAIDSLGARTAAVLVETSSDYSKSVASVFEYNFIAGGGTIVQKGAYLQKDTAFQGQLSRIMAAAPDVIFVPGYYNEVGTIIRQAREMGLQMPILGGDGWDTPKIIGLAGLFSLNNTYFCNHFIYDANTPLAAAFSRAFTSEYGYKPDSVAALGYEAALLLVAAIKKADSSEPEKIKEALEGIRVEGLLGTISIDSDHNVSKTAVVMTFRDGKQILHSLVTP